MTLPRLYNLCGLIALGCCFTACDNGCEQKRESFLHLSFTSTSGRSMRSMTVRCISGERGYELSDISKFDELELDLDPQSTQCVITFDCTYNDYGDAFTETETLIVDYTADTRFLDLACGCTVMYDISNAQNTGNLFRRVQITDSQVRTDSENNISIEY